MSQKRSSNLSQSRAVSAMAGSAFGKSGDSEIGEIGGQFTQFELGPIK
jgi:hypothetical protein